MTSGKQYYTGMLQPFTPKRKAFPVWSDKIPIGAIGQNEIFTSVKIWCYAPTINFPEASIFISMGNGKGSCFAKIAIDDLEKLVAFITASLTSVKQIYPSLIQQLGVVESQIENNRRVMEALRAMQQAESGDQPASSPQEE